MFRIFILLILSIFIQGCVYSSYTSKLEQPIERVVMKKDYLSSINSEKNGLRSASIGDELFVMNRYVFAENEYISAIPPIRKFPQNVKWHGTHKYNDGKSGDLIVYTTPEYYGGDIGVILDKNEHLATKKPLVQLNGGKSGRRWALNSTGEFFTIPEKNIDSWALRYGGKNNEEYVFEIVNKLESKTSDVLQTILVTEEKFISGFVIRNVLIIGVNVKKYGVIEYKIEDMLAPKT